MFLVNSKIGSSGNFVGKCFERDSKIENTVSQRTQRERIGAHDSVLSTNSVFQKDFVRNLYPRLLPTIIPEEPKNIIPAIALHRSGFDRQPTWNPIWHAEPLCEQVSIG